MQQPLFVTPAPFQANVLPDEHQRNIFSHEPGRNLRIIGGWNSAGGMRERIIELVAPDRHGGALPRPAYTVRVQVQRGNPNQIQSDNEFLMQAVKICADAGTPLPPETVIRLMEGYRSKEGVLRAIRENGSL